MERQCNIIRPKTGASGIGIHWNPSQADCETALTAFISVENLVPPDSMSPQPHNAVLVFNRRPTCMIISLLLYNMVLTPFLCVSILLCTYLPIWVQHSQHHLPNRVALEFFSSISLVYLSFCLQQFHAKICRVSKHDQFIDVSFAK